jgi:hypothetical protein
MSFQQTVLIIAVLVLVVLLIAVATMLHWNAKEQWPPVVGDCPDYWMDLSGNGGECVNTHSLGTCNLPTKGDKNPANFAQSPYVGIGGTCAKYKWASQCDVTWDGITSGVPNPCQTQ